MFVPVPHLATWVLDLAKQACLIQQIEGTVDGRDPDFVIGRLKQDIDLLGTEMSPASLHKEPENHLARRCPASAEHPDLFLKLHWPFALHRDAVLVIMRMILNTLLR